MGFWRNFWNNLKKMGADEAESDRQLELKVQKWEDYRHYNPLDIVVSKLTVLANDEATIDLESDSLLFFENYTSCVFVIRILNHSEFQIHHRWSLADLVYLNDDNGINIVIGIKFSTPIIGDAIFANTFTNSSALVITAKFVHKIHLLIYKNNLLKIQGG